MWQSSYIYDILPIRFAFTIQGTEGSETVLDIKELFQNGVFNREKLLAFGFEQDKGQYSISYPILDGQFLMHVIIQEEKLPSVKVVDVECEEEYVLIHTPEASGSFVGEVVQACEEKLEKIAGECYEYKAFVSSQAKEITRYVEKKYQSRLEFLWKKFPQNAVFRRADTAKWFAAMLTVDRAKLGLKGEGKVEVIDLRGNPREIAQMVDGKKFLPGYHMNKKNWYTICLDGSVDTREILRRIEESYQLADK